VRLLLERERLTTELESGLTERERRGLEAVRQAAAFGEKIGLEPSTSYRHLVDRRGLPLVTVVTSAPRDRLEPITWWFPIVGRVPYRGYFDAERAQRFARSLEARDLDTYVRPALTYSTLGWFDDPVPRALLQLEPFEAADTVLHEQVHESIFLSGDAAYNEGIALFVGHEAVLRLYADQPDVQGAAQKAFADDRRFAELLDRLARELESLYDSAPPAEALLRERQAIFERYRSAEFEAVPWQTRRYSGFGAAPLSNAYVVARRTYLGDLPCLEAELARLGGDLRAFVEAHRERPGRRTLEDGSCPSASKTTLAEVHAMAAFARRIRRWQDDGSSS
jgi:predicted aminopeptidase